MEKQKKQNTAKSFLVIALTVVIAVLVALGLAKTGKLPTVIKRESTEASQNTESTAEKVSKSSTEKNTEPSSETTTKPEETTQPESEEATETESETTKESEETDETETETTEETESASSVGSSGTVLKTTADLNVRKGPGTDYEKIGLLSVGTEIIELGEENGWVKIQYKGETGYISGDYLEKADKKTETTETNTSTVQNTSVSTKGYKIETIDGVTYVDGVLIANKTYSVPRDYGDGLTGECSSAFDRMQSDAAEEGIYLTIISGYRSYETQASLYNSYVESDGREEADTYSARPGTSEHQTGLAMDLNSLSSSFGETAEGKWLAENCHKYGFIIRYPQGKQSITGYIYEPWHIRYLGEDLAAKVYQSGLCLEEYYGITSSYD